jgi:hypothetical protein
MLDGNAFITANTAGLTAGDNMPPTFADTFTTAKTEFDDLYQDFLDASQGNEIETQTKITANNSVHSKLMGMFLDGQEIFKTDEAVKKLFTFDQVLQTVSGPGIAGVRGLIKDSVTNQPILATVTVTIFGTDYSTESEEDGRYEISPVAADTYTIVFTAPGYQSHQVPDTEIQTGVLKTLNVSLIPSS